MENEIDLDEAEEVLRGADLYEPNMSKEELVSYYKIIKLSENMASEEIESRRMNESKQALFEAMDEEISSETAIFKEISMENSFAAKKWSSETTKEKNEQNNNKDFVSELIKDLKQTSGEDASKANFGFDDMPDSPANNMINITHDLKFFPIQCTKKFLMATNSQKIKILYLYHTKINKCKAAMARKSFFPAPLPKISSITEIFPNPSDFQSDDVDTAETYISRSGRQTKRKIYYDDEDSLDETFQKKSKNIGERDWLEKGPLNKSDNKTKITNKKSENNNQSMEIDKTENSGTVIENNTRAQVKTNPLKKLNNTEIMKRSSLFANSPRRSSRCETMFDKLKESEDKKKAEEKAMEKFNRTLEEIDVDVTDKNADHKIITLNDESVRRRVIPPIPGRKPINNRRKNKADDGFAPLTIFSSAASHTKTTLSDSPGSSQEPDRTPRTRLGATRTAVSNVAIESPKPRTANVLPDQQECPICTVYFPKEKLVEHASSCGEDRVVTRASTKIPSITCEFCDIVVPYSTDFESHVKECKRKKE